jgi:hypothetical protein
VGDQGDCQGGKARRRGQGKVTESTGCSSEGRNLRKACIWRQIAVHADFATSAGNFAEHAGAMMICCDDKWYKCFNHLGISLPSFTMLGTYAASQGPKAIARA